MTEAASLESFDDAAALADAAADEAARILAGGIRLRGRATGALAGGTTPGLTYDRLSRVDIPWDKVTLTLTDERWVDPTSPDSNERMIRERLLKGPAQAAGFVGLKTADADPVAGAEAACRLLASLDPPLDLVVLGMGEDGHIASLFPSDPILKSPIPDACIPVGATGAPGSAAHPRVTLAPRLLTGARHVLLLITGEAKRRTFEQALEGQDAYLSPVRLVLDSPEPLRVLWAP